MAKICIGGIELTQQESVNELSGQVATLSGQNVTVAAALVNLDNRKANVLDLDGVKIKKITRTDYNSLVSQELVDSNTLYIITADE